MKINFFGHDKQGLNCLKELEKEHDNEELLRKQLEELKLPSHELPSTSSTANERSKAAEAQK